MALPEWKSIFEEGSPVEAQGLVQPDLAVAHLDETGKVIMTNALGESEWLLSVGMRMPRAFMYNLRAQVPDESGFYPINASLGDIQALHLRKQGGWLLMSCSATIESPTTETFVPSAFKSLIEKIPICIFRMRQDGVVISANDESQRITGYAPQETLNRPFLLEILHPEDRWKLTKALRDLDINEKITIGTRFQCKGDEETRFSEIHLYNASPTAEGQGTEVEVLFLDITDQSEVDEDLFLSESLYRAFLEQTPTGVIHLDETGIVTFENHRFRQLMGEAIEAAWIGQNIYAMQPFGLALDDKIRQMLRTGAEFGSIESSYARTHAEPLHVVLHGAPIRHPDGGIVGGVLLVEDVTKQKYEEAEKERQKTYVQAEAALREALFDHTSEGSFLERAVEILAQTTNADRLHILLRADSENLYNAYAIWPQDIVKSPLESLNKADYPVLMRMSADRELLHLYQGRSLSSDAYLLLEKTRATESIWCPFYENGRPFGFVVFDRFDGDLPFWDAAEQQWIEKLIHTFEALWGRITAEVRYNQTVAAIDECLFNFEFTPEGHRSYTFLTQQIEHLIGYKAETLLNQETGRVDWIEQIVDPADKDLVRKHDATLQKGYGSEVVYRVMHLDGGMRWLRESASPHRDSARRVTVGGILIDVTEQKTAESDLINAKRAAESANQLKSAFLATMSHEIRTPLGAVNGFAELLSRELAEFEEKNKRPFPAQITEFVTAIRENSQRLLTLVNDLFDLSNLEIGAMNMRHISVPLHEVVIRATSKIAVSLSQKGVELRLNLAPQDPVVLGDPLRIQQVLENLLENASKFTEQGSVTVSTHRRDQWIVVEIADTGVGMSEEYVSHLFTPFMQEDRRLNRRFKGTGLGLALAKRILELMNAQIEVESKKGQGSIFRILLPMAHYALAEETPTKTLG